MIQLSMHNEGLRKLFSSLVDGTHSEEVAQNICLDRIDDTVRQFLTIEDMREAGCFFTGDELSSEIANSLKGINSESVILDPTCGSGNLLIACSRIIPVDSSLTKTLKRWGKILKGYDLYPTFVELTKLRLVLEAVHRGCRIDCSLEVALGFLNGILTSDAMTICSTDYSQTTHMVSNPPFSLWSSPQVSFWKPGKVNAAAVVFERYISGLPKNCKVSVILPEVLRSGSRYEQWRSFVSSKVTGTVELIGRFNSKTDVDVFILKGKVWPSKKRIDWKTASVKKTSTIGDYFDVSVGPLVAYREPNEGIVRPYIFTKNVEPWTTVKDFNQYRAFKGKAFVPPFVVVRRTSSPTEKFRATGSIISGKEPVAVENHLIIIKPKSGTMADCKRLLAQLRADETNHFLNCRIRCRHLTVGSVREIPFDRSKQYE